ncbi:MAG: type IV toxin-antitoxin system AbiEi family antitoxin domain-containing protein, partial [Marmoricola sp.]
MERIAGLLADQAGTVSRRQLHAAGYQPADIERMVRRRDLSPRAPGVYLRHTAEPTWLERAWLALLSASSRPDLDDVALAHWTALRIVEGPGRRGAVEDAI